MLLPEGLELVIRVVDGKVQVTGPINEKLLCYALFECAKDAVRDYAASQQKVVVPVASMPTMRAN